MDPADDRQLLDDFVSGRSGAAFGRLVERHVDMVYAVARRGVGDDHLAEDVTQAVFLLLARRAGELGGGVQPAGWLFNAARYASADARKRDRRRQRRERKAARPDLHLDDPNLADDWERVGPLLDGAVSRLSPADRQAVVLRFYEGASQAEVAASLGVSEPAARQRVSRALAKLRRQLARAGISSSAPALTAMLAAVPNAAAPPAARAAAAAAASGQATPTAVTLASGAWILMSSTAIKMTVAAAALLLLLLAGVVVVERGGWRNMPIPPVAATPTTGPTATAAEPIGGTPAHPVVRYSDGTTAELTGIAYFPSEGSKWWGADGSPVPAPAAMTNPVRGGGGTSEKQWIEIRVELAGYLEGTDYTLRLPSLRMGGSTAGDGPEWPDAYTLSTILDPPADLKETELEFGYTSGPWTDVDVVPVADAAAREREAAPFTRGKRAGREAVAPTSRPGGSTPLRISRIYEANGLTQVAFTDIRYWLEWRALQLEGTYPSFRPVVISRDGRTILLHQLSYPDGQMTYTFNLPLSEVVLGALSDPAVGVEVDGHDPPQARR